MVRGLAEDHVHRPGRHLTRWKYGAARRTILDEHIDTTGGGVDVEFDEPIHARVLARHRQGEPLVLRGRILFARREAVNVGLRALLAHAPPSQVAEFDLELRVSAERLGDDGVELAGWQHLARYGTQSRSEGNVVAV